MTRERALWEAVATVALPSGIFWLVAAFLLRKTASLDAWPIYVFLFLLPLPLIFPIYKRYRLGICAIGKQRSRRYHITVAALYLVVGTAVIAEAFFHHRRRLDLTSQFVTAVFWLSLGIDHVLKAAKTQLANPPSADATF
jgi:hypothetical protein